MKTTISILAFFGSILFLLYTTFDGYSSARTGIDHYACETYSQPIDCIKR